MPKDTIDEVVGSFEKLNTAFETFKEKNDERLKELETKGASDPLLDDQLDKINKTLDQHQKHMDQLAAMKQRESTVEVEGKQFSVEEMDQKAAEWAERHANEYGKKAPNDFGYEELKTYSNAFTRFLRENKENLEPAELKALSVGSNTDGGFLVTPDMSGRMVKKVYETSPMRQVAAVQGISKDSLEGIYDTDEASSGWVAESEARPETGTPQVERWAIPVHEQYAMPKVTQKLLDDADVDISAWLMDKVADKFTRTENTAFVTGDGVGKPRGFLTYPNVTTAGALEIGRIERFTTGVNGDFAASPAGADKLIDLITNTKQPYRNGAVFAMNRVTVGGVRKLKDSDGAYVWRPGIAAGQPSTLLAYNVVEMEDMPDYTTTDALAVAFGNFAQAYQIVDRHGMRILRDPFTAKPHVLFYAIKRTGGAVINFEAIKLLEFTA